MKGKLLLINISGTNSKVKLYEDDNISENFEFKINGYQKGKIIENDSDDIKINLNKKYKDIFLYSKYSFNLFYKNCITIYILAIFKSKVKVWKK